MTPQRLAVFALLAACSGGNSSNDAHATADMRPPPDADFGDVPRVEPTACRFEVASSLGLAEGVGYACGDLVVEENRGAHTGRIRLHYIRIKSTATTNRATIYLDGGPGGNGQGILNYAAYLGTSFLDGLLVDGDFLVIGQRGTALSVPFVDCQTRDCSDYAGIADLTAYNTAYNADDVDELRSTLGLDQLNLYGISYGSRLGLEVLRRHGDHVRAAIIEGLVPPQVQWTAAIPASFYSALTGIDAACADDSACNTAFGDLESKLFAGVSELNATPVTITTSQGDAMLDGYSYMYILFRVMYGRSSYAWVPFVINDLAVGRTDRVGNTIAAWLEADAARSSVSSGLYSSVVCGELYDPPDPSAPEVANVGVPAPIIEVFGDSWYGLAERCVDWPKSGLQATLAQPVTSDVRTLVSSGRLDPITPPSFAATAATTLSNAVVVVHANSGHGATLQSACGTANLMAFLADPTTPHDTSCAASITTAFVLPTAAWTPPISKAAVRAELGISPVLPWISAQLRHMR